MGRTVIHLAASMLMLLQGVMPAIAFSSNLNRMSASPGMAYANDILGNRLTRNISSSNSSAQRLEWDWNNRVKDACGVSGGARFEYRADGMRTLKIEGLTIAWSYYEEDDKHEKGSGFYDDVWSWNQPTTRYYYDGQMGFEDDYAYQTGSYGSSTSHLDVTRYGLGTRGGTGCTHGTPPLVRPTQRQAAIAGLLCLIELGILCGLLATIDGETVGG